ncbi:atpD [Symbiodinium sp. CCMP2456]|nr:atpD [Symbiodinium sp. CCMP2456]
MVHGRSTALAKLTVGAILTSAWPHLPPGFASVQSAESRLAQLRRDHRWSLEELLAQIQRAPRGTQTCVLIDGPQYASNVGSVLRQAAVLQSPSDVLAAVLLASSKSSPHSERSASFPSEKFLKNVVRISLADRQALRRGAARLVVSPGDPRPALRELQRAGYHLVGLENLEACSVPSLPLWSSPLSHSKLCFVAGGEAQSLSTEILDMCDQQCHIPALNFDMAGTKSERLELGQESHTPSLNLAHAVVIALYERRRQLSLEGSFAPSS